MRRFLFSLLLVFPLVCLAQSAKVPAEKELAGLTRESLLAFNKALQAEDFTSFHGYIAKVWQEQIDVYAQLNQFTKRVPKLEEVITMDILKATAEARPRIG